MNANEVIAGAHSALAGILAPKGFAPKGKDGFLRKAEPHKREELVSLDHRAGKPPHQESLFLSLTCGIFYKSVNAADAKIEKDFLNAYPLAGGSAGHFRDAGAGYLSVPVAAPSDLPGAIATLREAVEQGAFNLFARYPTLASLVEGIERKDAWLSDFHLRPDLRMAIRQAAMRYVASGKEAAIAWFRAQAPEKGGKKAQALERMERDW